MNKIIKTLLLIIFLPVSVTFADDLATIEKAINIANLRLTQGITIIDTRNDIDFEKEACRLVEFALIGLNSKDLFNDYCYYLSIYCLARKHKRYKLAKSMLTQAYEAEEYLKLKHWIKKRIDLLSKENFNEDDFNISKEISDLRRNVLR